MIDPCECGDVERCTLCRFRQTYMSAADAWQAGLAMAKECESLQSQLTQARAELERERGWRKALHRAIDSSREVLECAEAEAVRIHGTTDYTLGLSMVLSRSAIPTQEIIDEIQAAEREKEKQ